VTGTLIVISKAIALMPDFEDATVEGKDAPTTSGQFYRRPKSPLRVGKTEAEKLIYGVTTLMWLLVPWLVYTTVRAKTKEAPVLDETLPWTGRLNRW